MPKRPPEAWIQAALHALPQIDDTEVHQRRLSEIEEARKQRRGPRDKFSEAQLRKQIRLDGGTNAGKKVVATALEVKESTLWRWCKRNGFLNWDEACWYYSKY